MSSIQRALVQIADEKEAAVLGSGLTWLRTLRDLAMGKLSGGAGAFVTKTDLNGHAAEFMPDMLASTLLAEVTGAIDEVDGDIGRFSVGGFSDFPH